MGSPYTVHLISLHSRDDVPKFQALVKTDYLIGGVPYGWVHRPHDLDKTLLTSKKWDLFFLTPDNGLEHDSTLVDTHIAVEIGVPHEQAQKLEQSKGKQPSANPDTPKLPSSWSGQIPQEAIQASKSAALKPGELYLDSKMSQYLSTAQPKNLRGQPVCFFNLFKYARGDRSTHDSYMNGFKERFGPAAGAEVKFMGPVKGELKVERSGEAMDGATRGESKWDDANLVQYDSVWHYAYMLGTEVYQELNQEKMRGLQDTCILMVSEVAFREYSF